MFTHPDLLFEHRMIQLRLVDCNTAYKSETSGIAPDNMKLGETTMCNVWLLLTAGRPDGSDGPYTDADEDGRSGKRTLGRTDGTTLNGRAGGRTSSEHLVPNTLPEPLRPRHTLPTGQKTEPDTPQVGRANMLRSESRPKRQARLCLNTIAIASKRANTRELEHVFVKHLHACRGFSGCSMLC